MKNDLLEDSKLILDEAVLLSVLVEKKPTAIVGRVLTLLLHAAVTHAKAAGADCPYRLHQALDLLWSGNIEAICSSKGGSA